MTGPDRQWLEKHILPGFIVSERTTVIRGNAVFAHGGFSMGPGYHDVLFCLDLATGMTRWQYGSRDLSIDLLSPVALGWGLVVVGRTEGRVIALFEVDGGEAWSVEVGGLVPVPCATADRLLVAAGERLLDLDPRDGRIRRAQRLDPPHALVSYDGNTIWLFGIGGGVTAVDPATLEPRWVVRDVADGVQHMAVTGGAVLTYAPAYSVLLQIHTDRVVALRHADGMPVWWRDFPGETLLKPAIVSGEVWLATSSGRVIACDPATGQPRLELTLSREVLSLAGESNRIALELPGGVAVLDADSGRLIAEHPLRGGPEGRGGVTLAGGRVFIRREYSNCDELHMIPLGGPWIAGLGSRMLT